jgi:hypothetical protein
MILSWAINRVTVVIEVSSVVLLIYDIVSY